MNENSEFPDDDWKNACKVVQVFSDEQWQAYHDIRRSVLFEARGLAGYDGSHPDDRTAGHFPLLLLFGDIPVGAARLDLMDNAAAGVRTVAIKSGFQRMGFGRTLLKALEEFASQHGSKTLIVKAARDAVGFYEALGWTIFDGRGDNPVLTKELRAHP